LGSSGFLDLLLINSDGLPIAVEVKLQKNSESRREVVAQAIDYITALADKPKEGDDVLIWTSERPRARPNGKGLELRGHLILFRKSGSSAKIEVQIADRTLTAQLGMSDLGIDLLEMRANEGSLKLATHLRRERDTSLVQGKKRAATAEGGLVCEVCEFDFEKRYGILGSGFCEVHHIKGLAEGAHSTIWPFCARIAIE
jgi:predicted HNH restriction endonuclease